MDSSLAPVRAPGDIDTTSRAHKEERRQNVWRDQRTSDDGQTDDGLSTSDTRTKIVLTLWNEESNKLVDANNTVCVTVRTRVASTNGSVKLALTVGVCRRLLRQLVEHLSIPCISYIFCAGKEIVFTVP